MPWTYQQSTGNLTDPTGAPTGQGYSGNNAGLNNPVDEYLMDQGPIPHGSYTIGPAFTHPMCGPVSMRLAPGPATVTGGRDGFLMHGGLQSDYISPDGLTIAPASPAQSASDGCIIMARAVRQLVSASADRTLQVIA